MLGGSWRKRRGNGYNRRDENGAWSTWHGFNGIGLLCVSRRTQQITFQPPRIQGVYQSSIIFCSTILAFSMRYPQAHAMKLTKQDPSKDSSTRAKSSTLPSPTSSNNRYSLRMDYHYAPLHYSENLELSRGHFAWRQGPISSLTISQKTYGILSTSHVLSERTKESQVFDPKLEFFCFHFIWQSSLR